MSFAEDLVRDSPPNFGRSAAKYPFSVSAFYSWRRLGSVSLEETRRQCKRSANDMPLCSAFAQLGPFNVNGVERNSGSDYSLMEMRQLRLAMRSASRLR